jgi:hypothetical protein
MVVECGQLGCWRVFDIQPVITGAGAVELWRVRQLCCHGSTYAGLVPLQ